MRILYAAFAVALVSACYRTGANVDTARADSGVVVSTPAVVTSPSLPDTARRADTGTVPAGRELLLRTDRSSYKAGERMTLTLVNPTGNSYAYNPCTRTLERENGGAWVEIQ